MLVFTASIPTPRPEISDTSFRGAETRVKDEGRDLLGREILGQPNGCSDARTRWRAP